MSDEIPVVRCWNCGLNQFSRNTYGRCREPLEKPVAEPFEPLPVIERKSWKSVGFHESISMRIGRRFKSARLAKGLSQNQLADKLGCPRTYLSKIENGNLAPRLEQLERLSRAVGITVADLVDSKRELNTRLILSDPFTRELLETGRGISPMLWKKTADTAERLSNGKRLAIS